MWKRHCIVAQGNTKADRLHVSREEYPAMCALAVAAVRSLAPRPSSPDTKHHSPTDTALQPALPLLLTGDLKQLATERFALVGGTLHPRKSRRNGLFPKGIHRWDNPESDSDSHKDGPNLLVTKCRVDPGHSDAFMLEQAGKWAATRWESVAQGE